MLFVKLEDLSEKAEVVVFPSTLERHPAIFQENKIILISGTVDHRDNSQRLSPTPPKKSSPPKKAGAPRWEASFCFGLFSPAQMER